MLTICLAAFDTGAGVAQPQARTPITDAERDAFGAALSSGNVEAVRAIVGRFVSRSDGNLAIEMSSPEALMEALRGCRLFEAARIRSAPEMWYRFVCPRRARTGLHASQDPGVYVQFWHHPAGMLVASWYPGAIDVRMPARRPPVPRRGRSNP
jgi:hypothetical protein